MKPKRQKEISELIEVGKRLGIKKYPQSLYAVVKKGGHFECGLHTRKTLDGVLKMIRKGYGYLRDEPFYVYEFSFKPDFIIFDSELVKNRNPK